MIVDEKDITIENGVASYDLNITGPVGGTYQGTFKFRCALTPMQEIEADRDYRDLLGKNAEFATTKAESLAYTLSQLRHRVVFSPPFWTEHSSRFPGSHVVDQQVLEVVLEAAVQSEIKYREALKEKHKASIERLKKVIAKQEEQDKLEDELEDLDGPQNDKA